MPAITIRNISDETHRALKARAASHNRSTEAEVRAMCERAGLEVMALRGSRPRFRWPLWRMLATGRVGDDFAFTWTTSLAIGYTGCARRLDLRLADRPDERVVPEMHQRHHHRDRP